MPPLFPEALISAFVALGVATIPILLNWLRGLRGEEREDNKTTFEQAMDIAQETRDAFAQYKLETESYRVDMGNRVRDLEEALGRERDAHVDTLRTLRHQAEQLREMGDKLEALTHENSNLKWQLERERAEKAELKKRVALLEDRLNHTNGIEGAPQK